MIRIDVKVPQQDFRLSVSWKTGERTLGVFGHSGAGKSTLLETLAGLRRGASGVIEVDGQVWLDSSRGLDLPPEKRGVGYVPQEMLLYPHRDVMGNLRAGSRRAALRAAATRIDERRVLEVLELGPLTRRDIASLSGGEKQRVALGRALLSGPQLLLLDEPLASLDLPLRRRILPYLVRVSDEFGIPTIYVSHDATEVRVLSSEVLVLSAGSVVAIGPPDDVFTADTVLPMARAEGFENVLRGRVVEIDDATALVEIEPGLSLRVAGHGLELAHEVAVGLRAEDLLLSVARPTGLSAQNILAGTIDEIRHPDQAVGGGEVLVMVALGRGHARAVVSITRQALGQLELAPSRPVHIIFKTQACRVLATRRSRRV